MKSFQSLLLAAGFIAFAGPVSAALPEPASGARQLFEQTLSQFHLPSAEARGAQRKNLLLQASNGYSQILKSFPNDQPWAAQALRSLGNVRAEQGDINEAVRLYASLEKKYPGEDWEILQSWKAAGDLLADHQRKTEADVFFKKIIERFDKPEFSPIFRAVVKGSRARLDS